MGLVGEQRHPSLLWWGRVLAMDLWHAAWDSLDMGSQMYVHVSPGVDVLESFSVSLAEYTTSVAL